MSRSTSALAWMLLGITIVAPTAFGQQTQGSSTAAPNDTALNPMAAARSARHLLHNGLDFLAYQEYERALDFFREAEIRKAELTATEQKELKEGIENAQRGLRDVADSPRQPYAKSRAGQSPAGAIAAKSGSKRASQARSKDSIQLTAGENTPGTASRAIADEPPAIPPTLPSPGLTSVRDRARRQQARSQGSSASSRGTPERSAVATEPIPPPVASGSGNIRPPAPSELTGLPPLPAETTSLTEPPAPLSAGAGLDIPMPNRPSATAVTAEIHLTDLPPLPGTSNIEGSVPISASSPSALPDRRALARTETPATGLTPELRREVERIAQVQEEEARRRAAQPATPGPGSTIDADQPTTKLELPRAPSPTEARPLRAIPVPEEYIPLAPRSWIPTRKYWAAAATCHAPLYFQDASLERYGHSVEQFFGPTGRYLTYPIDSRSESTQRNQIVQPVFSIGLLAMQILALPYNVLVDPPWEAEYDLGYYRPGDRIPTDTYYLPLAGVGPPCRAANY